MTVDTAKVAPWMADTPVLLSRTLSHTASVSIVTAAGDTIPVELETGTVEFDEARAPRASARLACRLVDDQALLSRIDPRTGARLTIDAGYVRPDRLTDLQPLVDLGLRSRTVSRPADLLDLEGASDEALIIDNAPSGSASTITGTNTVLAIQSVLQLIFPTKTLTNPSALTGAAVSQSPPGDKWDLMADLSDRLDAQTYDDGRRNWFITPAPTLSTPALELAVGDGGTILESAAGIDRDEGFYNRVFISYEWRDGAGVNQVVAQTRSITSGDYAATVGNTRTLKEVRALPATVAQAQAAATSLVKRTVSRGRSFTLEAISAYWLRPGHTVRVTLPLGDAEDHLVTAVAFDLKAGTMRVTTRLPDNTGTIGA